MERLRFKPNLLFMLGMHYIKEQPIDTSLGVALKLMHREYLFPILLMSFSKLNRRAYHRRFMRNITKRYLIKANRIDIPEHDIFVEVDDILWLVNGKLHREDGPALSGPHGEMWCINDKKHRSGFDANGVSLPAITFPSGVEWWFNGKLHRDDGPAKHDSPNTPFEGHYWYVDNKLHRLDGPAIIMKSGIEQWFRNGKAHRDGGPASIEPAGVRDNRRKEYWVNDGELHRDDGPARIIYDAYGIILEERWVRNGVIHRDNDEPAIREYTDGIADVFIWFQNNKKHRFGKPAYISTRDGVLIKQWWENGVQIFPDMP